MDVGDGTYYMSADHAIRCFNPDMTATAEYAQARTLSWIALLVYPLGIPVVVRRSQPPDGPWHLRHA